MTKQEILKNIELTNERIEKAFTKWIADSYKKELKRLNEMLSELKTENMKTFTEQNGVKLVTEHDAKGLTSATLTSDTNVVEIWKGANTGLWSISLSVVKPVLGSYGDFTEAIPTRTYIEKTHAEVLAYFDKKQYELGFFA